MDAAARTEWKESYAEWCRDDDPVTPTKSSKLQEKLDDDPESAVKTKAPGQPEKPAPLHSTRVDTIKAFQTLGLLNEPFHCAFALSARPLT